MLAVSRFTRNDFLWISLSAVCILASPTVDANIIDTTYGVGAGSFELGTFVNHACSFCEDFMRLAPGATTITGWTVGGPGDGVDWLTTPSFAADTGIHGVDLQDFTSSSIATVIPTVAGDVYELSFSTAAVFGLGNTGVVSAGSLVNQPFSAVSTSGGQTFTLFSFLFTAMGPTTTIQFIGTVTPNTTFGPVIDSVSVDSIAAVPEPDTILLFGIGLVGVLGYTRGKV